MTHDVRSGSGDLAPGDQIGGYRILEQIGRGGMAVVYRALDLRLGRPVALKVLAPELGADEAFRQRFVRESRAAAGVDHPNIVPVFEAGESAGVLFIAMQYISGGDVRSLIETEGRLSPARAAAIATQVAAALDAAHARGLVHRDVKPGNILLGQPSGNGLDHVYLSDFGLSKPSVTSGTSVTLTSAGQFLGTLDYVSPEQIQGQPADGRADQYGLACTVVEMLTGRPPYLREDSMALMWAQLEAAPPRLTERRPELPAAVDRVIGQAMAKSPASRYPTCQDFAAALTTACGAAPHRASALATGPAGPLSASPTSVGPARDPRPRPSPSDWPADNWPAAAGLAADGSRIAAPGPTDRAAAGGNDPVPGLSAQPEPELARNFLTPGAPGTSRRAGPPPSAGPDRTTRGTWPPPTGQASPARGRPARRTGRSVAVAILVALFVLGVAGAVAYRLVQRHDSSAPPQPPVTKTLTVPPARNVATVVRAYFAAINAHQYLRAWQLSADKSGTFAQFVAGFAGTERDVLKIESVHGDVVTAQLKAFQYNGTVKTYQGRYTVTGNVISAASVQRVS